MRITYLLLIPCYTYASLECGAEKCEFTAEKICCKVQDTHQIQHNFLEIVKDYGVLNLIVDKIGHTFCGTLRTWLKM